MAIFHGEIGYKLLKLIDCQDRTQKKPSNAFSPRESKIIKYFGDNWIREISDKHVLDFGCGAGHDALDIAEAGAARVVGMDIRERVLEKGRLEAARRNLSNVEFTTATSDNFDVIVSIDAMEHFSDPLKILHLMADRLKDSGEIWISFGPPWLHPLGGHLFSLFPWSHLLFSEYALCRWRSDFKTDGACRICDVEGGLNKITIHDFERYVEESPLKIDSITCIPIKPAHLFHNKFTKEFLTSIVVSKLTLKH